MEGRRHEPPKTEPAAGSAEDRSRGLAEGKGEPVGWHLAEEAGGQDARADRARGALPGAGGRRLWSGARALVLARPFHLAIAAVATGLALADAAPTHVVALSAGLAAALSLVRAASLGALVAALLLAGAAVGDLRLAAIDGPAALVRDGEAVRLRGHLLTPPRPGPFGSSAELSVASGRLQGARLLVRIPRWAPLPRSAKPGAELAIEGRTVALSTEGPDGRGERGSFDFAALLRRRGIAGELLLDHGRVTGARRGGLAGVLDRMRSRAERAVGAGMSVERAALLRGMVLGQDERIGDGVRDDFRASGLAHLLAVSGQNVMLLAALALPLLVIAGVGFRARLAVVAGLIALYVPLAGAGPSLQRAGVMGLAGLAAIAASRPASRWYALLLAAAATLAVNPRAWADPGWQLSFAAVAGILVLGVPLGRTLRRATAELMPSRPPAGPAAWVSLPAGSASLPAGSASLPAGSVSLPAGSASLPAGSGPRSAPRTTLAAHMRPRARAAVAAAAVLAADGLAITFAATVATAPLLAYHFGSVPLAGLPANMLALPAVAPAMWLGMVKAAVGQLGGGEAARWCAEALGALASLPVGSIALLAERFAAVPGAQLSLPLTSPLRVGAAYVATVVAAVALKRAARPLAPRALETLARWRRLRSASKAGLAAVLVAMAALGASTILGAPDPPDRLTVRFLDVGQGDATLIQHPDGTAVLFDGGPPEAGVARLLRRAGVEHLALVVATHASRDHHGGLAEVLRSVEADAVLDGGDGTSDDGFRAMLREAKAGGVRRIAATAPLALRLGTGALRVRILSPPPRPAGPAPEDPNPRAVVAVVSAGDFDLLLSADAESEPLLGLDLPDVEAMKVPHHGSSDPGLPEVLDRARPKLAAIEVGENTYGHPAPSTLSALRRANVTTYRTDRHGTVTLTVDAGEMRVQTER